MIESRRIPTRKETIEREIRALWARTGATTVYISQDEFSAMYHTHYPIKIACWPACASARDFNDLDYDFNERCYSAVTIVPERSIANGYIGYELPPLPPRKKVCDPMARHIGNCGAEDCPILPRGNT